MAQLSELEKLYTPSYWVKRYTRDILLQKYEELITKSSNEVRSEVVCKLNVPYGRGSKQKLDIFGTTLPNDAPIFIFIHGGYWQEGGKDFYSFIARSLYKNECKTIIVGYTLCPESTIADITEEIQLAIRKCLDYALENNARSLSIGGHSAGAHLVMTLFPFFFNKLTVPEKVLIKSIFLIGGIYDVIPLVKTSINNPLKLTEETAEAISPMFQDFTSISQNSPDFFIVAGENDTPAFIKQSQLFSDVLRKQGLRQHYVFLKNVDHFELTEKMIDENDDIIKLIIQSLK